ncbi:hypothetical protein [Nocardia farcinica]|uniref:hypothetical protein n=1 Tax=Nocardia farcinica TaxID=37329 RepID=UPI0024588CFF|nr:hypothetical protein [Nocardia farcinica]
MTITPQTFRPRATVEAVYFEDIHCGSLIAKWTGGSNEHRPDQVQIPTDTGSITAHLGEWVIRGHEGRFFTWPADTFAETYERVVPEDEQIASLEVQRARLQVVQAERDLAEKHACLCNADSEQEYLELSTARREARTALVAAQDQLSANARAFSKAATPASMPASVPPRPALGRPVLFQELKATCAAIVTHIHQGSGMVNLTVFNATGNPYPARFVRYADTLTPGHWSWMPER